MELIDALEAAADGVPLAEEVEDEASGTLEAAVERRGGMQAVGHGARSWELGDWDGASIGDYKFR